MRPAVQGCAPYYPTVGEALAKEEAQPGQRFRIAGNVTPGSIVDQPTDFRLSFLMEDEGGQVPVVYHGARPDNLQDGSGVVVEGDRKSTRLNSSHVKTSYAVFCLK